MTLKAQEISVELDMLVIQKVLLITEANLNVQYIEDGKFPYFSWAI